MSFSNHTSFSDKIEIQNENGLIRETREQDLKSKNLNLARNLAPQTLRKRLDWIDGMRGIAECVIFLHHFGDNTFTQVYPDFLGWASPTVWIRNGQFAVSVFFVLSARVLTYSFLSSARQKKFRWPSLASTVFRRSFRLAIPVALTIVIQAIVSALAVYPNMVYAQQYLQAPYLFPPPWEHNDIWSYLLKVFTLDDPTAILTTGSSLWSMYPQFWGSIYTYIITIITANMNNYRFAVYLIIASIMFYTTNVNFVFVFGLFLADLDASGWTDKFKRLPSYIVLSFQVLLASIMFFLMIDIDSAGLVNSFLSANTMRNGTFGWDAWQWPILLQPINNIILICLFGIAETSASLQHLFTFNMFVFIGKITFGMYLLQMTIIYTIMPSIVTSIVLLFSPSYIAVCVLAFIATFSFTAFIGWVWYKTVDEFALQTSHSLWKWFTSGEFSNTNSSFSTILFGLFCMLYQFILSIPSIFMAFLRRQGDRLMSLGTYFSTKVQGWRYWRDAVPPLEKVLDDEEKNISIPQSPQHSSLFPKHDFVFSTKHPGPTRIQKPCLFSRINSALYVLCYLQLLIVSFVWAVSVYFTLPSIQFLSFNIVYQSLFLLLLPYSLFLFFGLLLAGPLQLQGNHLERLPKRQVIGSLYVLVTMDLTGFANGRSRPLFFQSLLQVCVDFPFAKIVLLVPDDESGKSVKIKKSLLSFCSVVCVPASFMNQNTSFSVQAVAYFTSISKLHPSLDWILLLNSPCPFTEVDPSLFLGILEFIRFSKHELGVGLSVPSFTMPLLFNRAKNENPIVSLSQAHSFSSLVSLYSFQTYAIERPLFLHDTCLVLLSASVANKVAFQSDDLSFLYQWGWKAWQDGIQCGSLHVCMANQCDSNLSSLIASRSSFLKSLDQVTAPASPSSRFDFKHIGLRISKTFKNMVLVFTSFILSFPFAVYVDPNPSVFWILIPFTFSVIIVGWSFVVGIVLQWWCTTLPTHYSISAKLISWFQLVYSICLAVILLPFCILVDVYTIIQSQK